MRTRKMRAAASDASAVGAVVTNFDVIAPSGNPWEATVFTSRNSLGR